MATPDLHQLTQRFSSLAHKAQIEDALIKSEDLSVDPCAPKYICGECARSFERPQSLATHFAHIHQPFNYKPKSKPCICSQDYCSRTCWSKAALDRHMRESHPGGQDLFARNAQLLRDRATHSINLAHSCPTTTCDLTFPDQASLFAHYDGLHPLFVFLPGKKNPYKCPFCPKRYGNDRHMHSHQRRDHSSNRPSVGMMDPKDQGKLIQESQKNIARKASNAAFLAGSEQEAMKEEEANMMQDVEDSPAIKVEDGRIYIEGIKDEDEPVTPDMQQLPMATPNSISESSKQSMTIGFILTHPISTTNQTFTSPISPTSTTSTSSTSTSSYPEALALGPWELNHPSTRHTSTVNFPSSTLNPVLIHHILTPLRLAHWLSVSEVLSIWDSFLTPPQRIIILSKLSSIPSSTLSDTAILSTLYGTVFAELLYSWSRFKLLSLLLPPSLYTQAQASAKATVYGVLYLCLGLEAKIVFPTKALRCAPRDVESVVPGADMGELLEALERRVRCRRCHEEWVAWTNELVLKEMRAYVGDLEMEVGGVGL